MSRIVEWNERIERVLNNGLRLEFATNVSRIVLPILEQMNITEWKMETSGDGIVLYVCIQPLEADHLYFLVEQAILNGEQNVA